MATKYQDLSGAISPMLQASKEIGASVSNARRKSKKAVDVSQYKDFTSTLGQYSGGQTGTANSTPASISALGNITTPYMGSTIYEPGGAPGGANAHKGIDIANSIGTPIRAFAGGTVTESITGKQHGESGYGNFVKIVDDSGKEWRYSHLSENWVPTIGTKVSKNQEIGKMGASGSTYSSHYDYDPNNQNTWGSHLDLRIKDLFAGGKYVDPLSVIKS